MVFDIQELKEILPQRFPFLMIDRVTKLEEGKKVTAIKNVSMNEPFFQGHFPNLPVMPGVLITEAMAQAGIVLLCGGKKAKEDTIYYLGGIKIRFLKPVVPGDQLKVEVVPLKIIKNSGVIEARAYVKDDLVAKGELSFTAK